MPSPPISRDAIIAALIECGPMTVSELVEHLGWKRTRIDTCISTARANHPGKFIRIVGYRPQTGTQGREAAIYAARPGPDVPRPVFGFEHRQQRKRRYYLSNRARLDVTRKRKAGSSVASPWAGLITTARRANKKPHWREKQ